MGRHPDPSLVHLLHRAGQCAADVFQAEISDLTPRQFATLMAVARSEGANQSKLVRVTGIDRVTLTDIVRRLVRKGLLHRQRTRNDARAYAVKLTDEGRRLLNAATPIASRVDARVIGVLSNKRREPFLAALASIVETLQTVTPSTQKTLTPRTRRGNGIPASRSAARTN